VAKNIPTNPLVVYIPILDRWLQGLKKVIREVRVVGKYVVVFLWFHWLHDLPVSLKEEWEPLAVAYKDGVPKYVFWRPHRMRKWRRVVEKSAWASPMKEDSRIVVFISYLGHAPKISRRSIIYTMLLESAIAAASTFLTLYSWLPTMKMGYLIGLATLTGSFWLLFGWRLIYSRVENLPYVEGEGPKEADVYEGVSFRGFVEGVLSRPENNKNNHQHRLRWLRRMIMLMAASALFLSLILYPTALRLILAGRCFEKGDLGGAYKNLIKAYLALPTRFKQTFFGCFLLDNIAGLKQVISQGMQPSKDQLYYARNKFYTVLFYEGFFVIMASIDPKLVDEDRPDDEDLKDHLKKIKSEKPVKEPLDPEAFRRFVVETLQKLEKLEEK
jgi:hypothetical protein